MLFIHKGSKQTLHIGDLLLEYPHLDVDNLILPDDYAEVLETPRPPTQFNEFADATIQEVNNEFALVWTIREMTQKERDDVDAFIKEHDDKIQQRMQDLEISTEHDISDPEITIESLDIINTSGPLIIDDSNN